MRPRIPRRLSIMLILVCGLGVLSLPAQEAEADDAAAESEASDEQRDVFAPFVSRLRVAVRDPQVRLTWRDSSDLPDGLYRVYRHTTEIVQDTLRNATLVAEVQPGVETYLDTPLEEGSYYYAVLASTADGRVYPIFIPFRNITITAVTVAQLESEEDLAASVYDIEAAVQDNAVAVRFVASRNGRELVAYRSTVPFDQLGSITEATLLDSFDSVTRRFSDYPVPGVDYYYGVFDRALLELDLVTFDGGENVLAAPIRISLTGADDVQVVVPSATLRRAPLPVLQFGAGLLSSAGSPQAAVPYRGVPQPISATTQAAVAGLLSRSPRPAPFSPEPVILPTERVAEGEGASLTLAQIVLGDFSAGRYAQAVRLLRNLLQVRLSPDIEDRVRFYLGQALYLDGRVEPAFVELLIASEGSLYTDVRPWLDGILQPEGG